MDYIHLFESFKKGMQPGKSAIQKIVSKVITKKNFPNYTSRELKDEKYRFESSLNYIFGGEPEENLKFSELPNHPNFKDIRDPYNFIILSMTGYKGKSKNKKFIKLLLSKFRNFPVLPDQADDAEYYLNTLIYVKNKFEENKYPDYTLLNYSDRKELRTYMDDFDIPKKLSSEEIKYLQKSLRNKYEYVSKLVNDRAYEKAILYAIKKFNNNDSDTIKAANRITQFPEVFELMKSEFNKSGISDKNWKSFEVSTKYNSSDNSSVVSSSFSTTYYYDIEIKFMGKKFKYDKFAWSSDYYSGGWN